jgi:hypothetical protein
MPDDDLRTGSAPIRKRDRAREREQERSPGSSTRVNELDPLTPDAISPEARSDTTAPVPGGLTPDAGLGAAGGRDRGGPGGQERAGREAGEVPGRAVDSDPKD